MNVLQVGIFEDHALGGDLVFEGGLKANPCDVTRFDHRALARAHGVVKMNARLVDAARGMDLVFVGKEDGLARATLAAVRRVGAAPQGRRFFMSSAGEVLRAHFELASRLPGSVPSRRCVRR